MEWVKTIEMVGNLITALALFIGAGLAVFVFSRLAPVLNLRIIPSWAGDKSRWVILRLEVENKSRVRIHKQSICLQVLEYRVPAGTSFSEWVPFEEEAIVASEQPLQWSEPIEVFKSTLTIDPNEVLAIERLHYCPPDTLLKVGLQVRMKLGIAGRIATRVRGWHHQRTTTRIVMKET
jgi:hypothetical protein